MSYSLKPGSESLQSGLRRIAADQLEAGIAALDAPLSDSDTDLHAAVHDARKRVKKLRGLMRLVRPGFDGYAGENAYLRDSARLLSEFRDHTARIDSYDSITSADTTLDRSSLGPMRRQLTMERREAATGSDLGDRIAGFRDALKTTRGHVGDWTLKGKDDEILADGLKTTFARARDAMETARSGNSGRAGNPEDMHEWRKRVKYHWYHARLLRRLWPPVMAPHIDAADRLADTLGAHHDLVVFAPLIGSAPLNDTARAALAASVEAQAAARADDARDLGARLFAPHPKWIAKTWSQWWMLAR
ncbi:CHAD domain-containing protein [Mesobaculum littorinae]|uniref:CHAD domain-containing protein n=1 Tax=Mesobaculum littorinae TaxID=2486419 RepID=A0A438AGC4_9RHOB|nr:CHAD domain-containing protein [Mesobaculum littorinae]RVV97759.1 CHAD domain-containing protein [Mesobaculum littorinae]